MLVVRNAFHLNGVMKNVGDELSAEEHKIVDKAKAIEAKAVELLSEAEQKIVDTAHTILRNCVRRS